MFRDENQTAGIGWVVEMTDPTRGRWKKQRQSSDELQEKHPVRFCTLCKMTWEFVRVYSKRIDMSIQKYMSLPTRGIKREVCPLCNKQQHTGKIIQCKID